MDGRSILLAFLPVGLTLITYAVIRDLIWGIFLGNKSKKSALRIKGEAKGFQKLSQRYMQPHIKKYETDYKKWMGIKLLVCILTVLQLIGYAVMIILGVPFWIVAIVCGVFIIFNVVLFILMMNQTATSTNKKDTKGSPWRFEQ